MLPKMNEKDLEEVPETVKENMNFRFVERVDEAIEFCLTHPAERRSRRKEIGARVTGQGSCRGRGRQCLGPFHSLSEVTHLIHARPAAGGWRTKGPPVR
jgi:hypothetical protein